MAEIGARNHAVTASLFCTALTQLAGVRSSQLCVAPAAGGDPQYPFNVKMLGDEVLGNSGSFRHFLSSVSEQLQTPTLSLLVPFTGPGHHTGRYFLKPGPLNMGEERMLQFLGQLIGVALRAGIPLPLPLMPSFWSALAGEPAHAWQQCRDWDPVAHNHLAGLETCRQEEWGGVAAGGLRFTYRALTGEEVELLPGGAALSVSWEDRAEYCGLVKGLRLGEWQCRERVEHILAGLATTAPIAFIQNTFTPAELELRVCGQPRVDLAFLRHHTIYQVGISGGLQLGEWPVECQNLLI